MGSMAICLFIYFIRRGEKNLPISVCIWGAWATLYRSSSYMKNNVVYGYTFIYNGNMGSGLFYNVPYFRLGLTAFYGPPAVHLHVSGRQEHCIIMSFPAPKCYFTGRGSFLKLHHFYNFPNFYSRHYYQQDFITYLECKQVWVMTLPRLPGIIPADGSAAISDTWTHTPKHARLHEYTKPHIQSYKNVRPRKPPQPGYDSKAVIYYPVCVRARMHVWVPDKGGGGEGEAGGGGNRRREFYTQLT